MSWTPETIFSVILQAVQMFEHPRCSEKSCCWFGRSSDGDFKPAMKHQNREELQPGSSLGCRAGRGQVRGHETFMRLPAQRGAMASRVTWILERVRTVGLHHHTSLVSAFNAKFSSTTKLHTIFIEKNIHSHLQVLFVLSPAQLSSSYFRFTINCMIWKWWMDDG